MAKTEKEAARATMPIFTVPMRTKKQCGGFTFAETLVALLVISMLTLLSIVGYRNISASTKFRATADTLINFFDRAGNAASQTDRRYAVMIDFFDNNFILYEVNTDKPYAKDYATLKEEDIILSESFTDDCVLFYVQFDDSDLRIDAGEGGKALFVVGKAGWDFGGKIVLMDNEGELYSVVISRIAKSARLVKGDAQLPKPEFDLSF